MTGRIIQSGSSTTPGGPTTEVPALAIRNMSKSFSGRRVLGPVDLSIRPGEIHFLLGQNGSGKSTLIKILSGNHVPDPGSEVLVAGERMQFGSPDAAHMLGCRFVHQDLGLVGSSSVLDNLLLSGGFPTAYGMIRRKAALLHAREALTRVGLEDVDPRQQVSALSRAQQTGVAIARALDGGLANGSGNAVRVLALDEPTAALPAEQVKRLLSIIRASAAEGVAIIYVTHHLDEAFELAARISVLRDGQLLTTSPIGEIDRERVIHLLVGAKLEEVDKSAAASRKSVDEGQLVLRVRGLSGDQLSNVSLEARKHEVIGVHGLAGSGSDSLLAAIFGARARAAGRVETMGRGIAAGRPDRAIAAGIGYLAPDRKLAGGLMGMSAVENLTLAYLKPFWRRLRIRKTEERREARDWFSRLDVRPADGIKAPLATFSGGNQQKILLAKWLRLQPRILLLDEPTQGVDIGAKAEIHRQILDAAAGGATVIVHSTDEKELVTLCSRVIVFRDGQLVDELSADQLTESTINRNLYAAATPASNHLDLSPRMEPS
jgi:ribose transport system ATP-binding protein